MKKMHIALLCAAGFTLAGSTAIGGSEGPKVVTDASLCQLTSTRSWGRVGDIHAYSIRTDTWNTGNTDLTWEEFTPLHPVMAQNIYRYKDGRLEQVGLSWIKHGFCALQQSGCGSCFVQQGCLDFLGAGCRDPYSANLNGNQTRLGPRSEVNPSTGEFPYPFTLGWGQTGDLIFKRIQVHDDDINPASNPGAKWYIEGQIMHQEEGTADIRHNNATHEEVIPTPDATTFSLGTGFGTVQQLPAIYAWQANDPEVVVLPIDIPGEPADGRFHLAYRVFDNGDGTWRYEYALHNLNSHRSARGFTVPLGGGAQVQGTHYRDVKYHSGEVYTNEDWAQTIGGDFISWMGQSFETDTNANALRWGTMFNFAVTTNSPPADGEVTIALFRPGAPESVQVAVLVPGEPEICVGDVVSDQQVNVDDLLAVINAWGPCRPPCPADIDGNGNVNVDDLLAVINGWGPCP